MMFGSNLITASEKVCSVGLEGLRRDRRMREGNAFIDLFGLSKVSRSQEKRRHVLGSALLHVTT
jgi:hypothetical protein